MASLSQVRLRVCPSRSTVLNTTQHLHHLISAVRVPFRPLILCPFKLSRDESVTNRLYRQPLKSSIQDGREFRYQPITSRHPLVQNLAECLTSLQNTTPPVFLLNRRQLLYRHRHSVPLHWANTTHLKTTYHVYILHARHTTRHYT